METETNRRMTTKRNKTVCVFCSSSSKLSEKIKNDGALFARLLAEKGFNLLYGGSMQGLMRIVADSHKAAGGYLIGVIPTYMTDTEEVKKRFGASSAAHADSLGEHGKLYEGLDEVITTDDMGPRKQLMLEKSDYIVCLPGGVGTYDEFFTVLALKQVGSHKKPIFLLNSDNYFDALVNLLKHGVEQKTIMPGNFDLFKVCPTPQSLIESIVKS